MLEPWQAERLKLLTVVMLATLVGWWLLGRRAAVPAKAGQANGRA